MVMAVQKKFIVLVCIGVLLIVIGVVLIPVVDIIVRQQIKKKVVISNTSELYEIWEEIPVPIYMQFYMFNVLNVDEILEGGKPHVAQQGPYTYRERRAKFDIIWNSNGTVSYRQNRTYHFIPEMSSGAETDMITTINPLIATLSQGFQWLPQIIKETVSLVLHIVSNQRLFTTRPVSELLWGYEDPSLVRLRRLLPSMFPSTIIGYFIRRNYTNDGVYTIITGEKDLEHLGKIDRYNGQGNIDIWTTPWARMINGSDGTLSPPFEFNRKEFVAYVSDLCRSIRGVYKGQSFTPQDIELRRYGGDPFDMMNATVNPDNIGFCIPQYKCLPSGLLNATLCEKPVNGLNIPLIFSFPHFLNADPEVVNSITGMEPNRAEHDTYIDIEPWTGLILQVAQRLQVNMFVEQVEGFVQTSNIKPMYFPIFWLNESSVTDDKHANMLKDQLFTPLMSVKIIEIVLFCVGGILVALGVILLIWSSCSQRKSRNKARMAIVDDSSQGNKMQSVTNPSQISPDESPLPPPGQNAIQENSVDDQAAIVNPGTVNISNKDNVSFEKDTNSGASSIPV